MLAFEACDAGLMETTSTATVTLPESPCYRSTVQLRYVIISAALMLAALASFIWLGNDETPAVETLSATEDAAWRPQRTAAEHVPEPTKDVPLQKIQGRCGTNVKAAPESKTRVVARASVSGRVRIQLIDFPFYCSPGPEFVAARSGKTVRIAVQPLKEGARRTNCTCLHRVELMLKDLSRGSWNLRVDTGKVEPVLRDGKWVNDPVEATAQFEVPR